MKGCATSLGDLALWVEQRRPGIHRPPTGVLRTVERCRICGEWYIEWKDGPASQHYMQNHSREPRARLSG